MTAVFLGHSTSIRFMVLSGSSLLLLDEGDRERKLATNSRHARLEYVKKQDCYVCLIL